MTGPVIVYSIIAIASLIYAGFVFLWPSLISGFGEPTFTNLYRIGIAGRIILPAIVIMICVFFSPRGHTRKYSAYFGSLFISFTIVWAGVSEYRRLSAFRPKFSWMQISTALDWYMLGASLIGFLACLAIWLSSTLRPIKNVQTEPSPKRAKSSVHGTARWATMKEVSALLPSIGAIPVGELYRVDLDQDAPPVFRQNDPETWGRGGKAPLACFNLDFGSGHSLIFAGSGGFKTTANVIPTLLHWPHNVVALDPSLELAPIVEKFRRSKVKKNSIRKIVVLDPSDPTSGFNVLDWIGTGKGTKEEDISNVVSWITTGVISKSDPDSFFRSSAQTLLTGVLAYICLDDDFQDGPRTLKTLRDWISADEKVFRDKIREKHEIMNKDTLAYKALGPFLSMTEATFSGIYASAADLTKWLSFSRYADLVSGGRFETKELIEGDIDVFIALDLKTLDDHSGLARVIIGALLNALYNARELATNNVLFMLDEAARLGGMKIIETARDAGRKSGITMQLIYQSVGQLKDQWGGETAVDKWFSSTSFQAFAAVTDLQTAEWLSKRCGNYTTEVISTSQSANARADILSSGSTTSRSTALLSRALIRPEEIVSTMRRDDQIILIAGTWPIRLGRAIYFRRPEMLEECGKNKYARTNAFGSNAPQTALPSPLPLFPIEADIKFETDRHDSAPPQSDDGSPDKALTASASLAVVALIAEASAAKKNDAHKVTETVEDEEIEQKEMSESDIEAAMSESNDDYSSESLDILDDGYCDEDFVVHEVIVIEDIDIERDKQDKTPTLL